MRSRKQNFLIPQSYDPGVTRMDRAAFGRPGTSSPSQDQERRGPIKTNDIPFTLIANDPSFNLSTANKWRRGLMLQNKDPVERLYYRFGGPADANSFYLIPDQVILLDFTCPTDPVWVFATANVAGSFAEMARSAD